MAKKKTPKAGGAKPLTFKQAIKGMLETPYRTHKELDALRKSGKLDDLIRGKTI